VYSFLKPFLTHKKLNEMKVHHLRKQQWSNSQQKSAEDLTHYGQEMPLLCVTRTQVETWTRVINPLMTLHRPIIIMYCHTQLASLTSAIPKQITSNCNPVNLSNAIDTHLLRQITRCHSSTDAKCCLQIKLT